MAAMGFGTGPRGGGGRARCRWRPAPGSALGSSWHRPPGPGLASDGPGRRRAAASDLVTDVTAGRPLATVQTVWDTSTGVPCGLPSRLAPLKPKLGQAVNRGGEGAVGRSPPRCRIYGPWPSPDVGSGLPLRLKVCSRPPAVRQPWTWSLRLRQKPASARGQSLGVETRRPESEPAVPSLTVRRGQASQPPGPRAHSAPYGSAPGRGSLSTPRPQCPPRPPRP